MKRPPKQKPNTLDMAWVESEQDIMYSWGNGCDSADARYIHSVFTTERMDTEFPTGEISYDKSVVEELEARGYDLTTIKFSIKKKLPKS